MANIIYRSTASSNGAGNANKGVALTISEVDGNFYGLQVDVNLRALKTGDTFTGNLIVTGTGQITLGSSGDIQAYRSGGGSGVVYLNSANTKYLYNDGTNYNLPIQGLIVGGVIQATSYTGAGTGLTGSAASLSIGGSAATVTAAAQTSITSLGTLTGLSVSGTATIGTLSVTTQSTLYAPSATSSSTVLTNWIRSPKNTVTAFIGDNDSVSGYVVDDFSGNIRFNGTGVLWGDLGYYPIAVGTGNWGQFRFSTTGAVVGTAPNATVGVGILKAATRVIIGTNADNTTSALQVTGTTTLGLTNAATITASTSIGVGTSSTPESVMSQKNTTTVAATSTEIFAFPTGTYRSVDLNIQAVDAAGGRFHSSRTLAIHDGAVAQFTEYGSIYTANGVVWNSLTVTYSASVVSLGSVPGIQVFVTPVSTNSTVFKVFAVATKV